jgi:hypothetical protein
VSSGSQLIATECLSMAGSFEFIRELKRYVGFFSTPLIIKGLLLYIELFSLAEPRLKARESKLSFRLSLLVWTK